MKYYLIAGEASGDLHGSNLMKHIIMQEPNAVFRYWGGDKMHQVGGTMAEHYRNTAFMGFAEVLKNLVTILNFIKKCKKDITHFAPDVLILIDYPGFNLRIAKWAKIKGYKVVYYITPQIWAWHKSRVHQLGKYTDKLLVILPFETAFFSKYGYESLYVGHPLLDAVADFRRDPGFEDYSADNRDIIALLPGSRKQEIKSILPVMLDGVRNSNYKILLAGAPAIDDSLYYEIIKNSELKNDLVICRNQTYDVLSVAKFALVSSGTATLETALFGVPQVVCYKGSPVSYAIAKKLIDIKFISLVNLIADKEVVIELIQENLTPENIKAAIITLAEKNEQIKKDYHDVRNKLGNIGASQRAAVEIIKIANNI